MLKPKTVCYADITYNLLILPVIRLGSHCFGGYDIHLFVLHSVSRSLSKGRFCLFCYQYCLVKNKDGMI